MSRWSRLYKVGSIALCSIMVLILFGATAIADDIVRIGSSVEIEEGRILDGDAVSIGGSVTIKGEVRGDAVSVGGSVYVSGVVNGDVVATGGSVVLDSTAVVYGEVTSVGGTLDRHPDAEVHGEVNEVAFELGPFKPFTIPRFITPGFPRTMARIPSLFSLSLMGVVVTLVFVLFVILIVPTPTHRLSETIQRSLGRTVLVGLLADILFLPAMVILAISIVGIPLILLSMMALMVALLFGLGGVALATGQQLIERSGERTWHPIALALLGVVVIGIIPFLSTFFDSIVSFFGFVIAFGAWTIGLGAVILTRFGTRLPQYLVPASPPGIPEPEPAGTELQVTETPPAPEVSETPEATDTPEEPEVG
jgi:hypothetical protein